MPEGVAADAERTAFLASRDYRVPRFWNNDVLGNIDGVMTAIVEALESRKLDQFSTSIASGCPHP